MLNHAVEQAKKETEAVFANSDFYIIFRGASLDSELRKTSPLPDVSMEIL